MKKTFLAALVVICLSVPFIFSGCAGGQEGFAIYLTRDDIPVSEMEKLSHVNIADEPIISGGDIINYYWDTHEITLTYEAYERIVELDVPTSGMSFVVCVNKAPVYWGAFWTPVSSQSFSGVTIWVLPIAPHDNYVRLELGYPSPSFFQGEDPRSDPVIFESLEQAGKLK